MGETELLALRAAQDSAAMEQLLVQNENFILRAAGAACHRFITKGEDEWAIALEAFSSAVSSFHPDRGLFLPFAQLVIRNRLTDYYRSQARFGREISVAPSSFDEPPEEDSPQAPLQAEIIRKIAQPQDDSLKWEIEAANRSFSAYGFSFFDLASCSPKAEKTRHSCTKAVAFLVKNPLLFSNLQKTGELPIKKISENTGVPQKILERHRRYIIAAAEILSGEFPCLAEYMRCVREELER